MIRPLESNQNKFSIFFSLKIIFVIFDYPMGRTSSNKNFQKKLNVFQFLSKFKLR
jgi:hypothetical protein